MLKLSLFILSEFDLSMLFCHSFQTDTCFVTHDSTYPVNYIQTNLYLAFCLFLIKDLGESGLPLIYVCVDGWMWLVVVSLTRIAQYKYNPFTVWCFILFLFSRECLHPQNLKLAHVAYVQAGRQIGTINMFKEYATSSGW